MKTIALTAAAFLIASGSAFAAGGSGQSIQAPGNDLTQTSQSVDTTTTGSIVRDIVGAGHADQSATHNQANPDFHQGIYGQGRWGH